MSAIDLQFPSFQIKKRRRGKEEEEEKEEEVADKGEEEEKNLGKWRQTDKEEEEKKKKELFPHFDSFPTLKTVFLKNGKQIIEETEMKKNE